jgi:hypothetical protein
MVLSFLAVHIDKFCCGISIASRSVCRQCAGKRGNIFRRKRHIESTKSLGKPITPACANQWDDVFALRRDPSNCDLCHGRSDLPGNRSQLFDQREIGLQILALEARAYAAEVLLAGTCRRPVATNQTTGEHAISGDSNP